MDAELVCPRRQVHRVRGRVGAGAGDHACAVADGVHCSGVQLEALLVGERRPLTGRAGDDDAVRAALDQVRGELTKLLDVDGTVLPERRHDRRQDLAEHGSHSRDSP